MKSTEPMCIKKETHHLSYHLVFSLLCGSPIRFWGGQEICQRAPKPPWLALIIAVPVSHAFNVISQAIRTLEVYLLLDISQAARLACCTSTFALVGAGNCILTPRGCRRCDACARIQRGLKNTPFPGKGQAEPPGWEITVIKHRVSSLLGSGFHKPNHVRGKEKKNLPKHG